MAKKRKKNTGTVRKRKDGRWEGRVVVSYDENGMPKTKSVLARTKTECVEKLEKLKIELGKTTAKPTANMLFGEWIDHWYQTYKKPTVRLSTQGGYEQRIYNQIVPKIGDVPLSELTTGRLERFYAHLKADGRLVHRETFGSGIANSIVRSIHALCRASLEKACAEGLLRTNPAVNCKLPPKNYRDVQVLTPEEMQRLLIQAKYEGFYEMFLLDLATGLRRGELLALQWSDINMRTGEMKISKQVRYHRRELHVTSPKTKAANRTILLPPPVLAMLKEYKKTLNSKWLFPSPVKSEDVPRDPTACRKAFALILEKAGCKHVPFHALRHTFATQSLSYGMDVKTLASTIGHTSVETTLNVYAHATDDSLRAAAQAVDHAIGTKTRAEGADEQTPTPQREKQKMTAFEAVKGKTRKRGTGYIGQISKNSWQGRYSVRVDGKRITRNIYAPTEEECEKKLAELIAEMKVEFGKR